MIFVRGRVFRSIEALGGTKVIDGCLLRRIYEYPFWIMSAIQEMCVARRFGEASNKI
jgi:hypothetical protein